MIFHRFESHFQVNKNFDPLHKQYKHFASKTPTSHWALNPREVILKSKIFPVFDYEASPYFAYVVSGVGS